MFSRHMPSKLGWIGLGAMGFPMALQLQKKIPASSVLIIYDIDNSVLDHFIDEADRQRKGCPEGLGGTVVKADSSKEVANNADFVITIVPEGRHVKDVFLNQENGILTNKSLSGKVFVDCSTIDIETSLFVGKAIEETHQTHIVAQGLTDVIPPAFFDAPVSEGTAGASSGSLTVMLGAASTSPHLPLLTTVLGTFGKNIYPVGGPSLGLAAKLSNNYLSGLIALATSEAMNMGMRLGIDPKVLQQCFSTSSGGSWVNDTVNPVPGVCPDAVTSRGYEGGFKVQLMKKDMTLAIEAAKQVDAKLVLGEAGLSAYAAASDDPRCRDKDSRVVYRWLGGIEPIISKPEC
ncbi:6-phosphogluconate dehydrogenase [Panaeolus papilionaceus]|nr:6-phosphogluconate dehydrogenase [Panaeolus papilionaceus]